MKLLKDVSEISVRSSCDKRNMIHMTFMAFSPDNYDRSINSTASNDRSRLKILSVLCFSGKPKDKVDSGLPVCY